jgi:hypothetical protein
MQQDTMAPATQPDPRQRRPYQKPAFRHESVFETMALACGKIRGTQSACNSRRNAS